jgi:hypothetical protein
MLDQEANGLDITPPRGNAQGRRTPSILGIRIAAALERLGKRLTIAAGQRPQNV